MFHYKPQNLEKIFKNAHKIRTFPIVGQSLVYFMGISDPRCRIVPMATNALKTKLKKKINSLSFPPT